MDKERIYAGEGKGGWQIPSWEKSHIYLNMIYKQQEWSLTGIECNRSVETPDMLAPAYFQSAFSKHLTIIN